MWTSCHLCLRSVGGIRVSMFNAVTVDEVQQLVKFMREFAVQVQQQQQK